MSLHTSWMIRVHHIFTDIWTTRHQYDQRCLENVTADERFQSSFRFFSCNKKVPSWCVSFHYNTWNHFLYISVQIIQTWCEMALLLWDSCQFIHCSERHSLTCISQQLSDACMWMKCIRMYDCMYIYVYISKLVFINIFYSHVLL